MNSILELFKGDPWLNLIFFILAILSIFLAYFFYLKSLKEKKPFYSTQTFSLIKESITKIKNIDIKYNNTNVNNLSLTKFAIWNAGKESIKFLDIATTDPLIITSNNNYVIYDFEISHQKEVNNLSIKKIDDSSILISFEYLDYNEGFVLNIYHSGKKSSDLKINGTIIGSSKISLGIKKDVIIDKFLFIGKPVEYFINKENLIAKYFGYILFFPTVFILIPIFIFVIPFDLINDKIINKTPKEFYLFDEIKNNSSSL